MTRRFGPQRAAGSALQQSDRLFGLAEAAILRRSAPQRRAAASFRVHSAVRRGESRAVERGVRERDRCEAAGVFGDEEPERVRDVSLAERKVAMGRAVPCRNDVLLRNGCVNRISSPRNSVQYVLFYLEEAFRTLSEREIGGISGVLVSFIFHILALFLRRSLIPPMREVLIPPEIRYVREGSSKEHSIERRIVLQYPLRSLANVTSQVRTPPDLLFRSFSLRIVFTSPILELAPKRGFQGFSCFKSRVWSKRWSRCAWICGLMRTAGRIHKQAYSCIERWIIKSLCPTDLYHYFCWSVF